MDYRTDNYVVLDAEVDAYINEGQAIHPENDLVLFCWRYKGKAYSKWGDEFNQAEIIEHIEQADVVVAHNAKYDLGWLKRCGLDISDLCVYDTAIGEYVLMGNLAAGDKIVPRRRISLDACCKRRGWEQKDSVVDRMFKQGVLASEIPKHWLEGRCSKDVADCERLFRDQLNLLDRTDRTKIAYTRNSLTPVLALTEFEGSALDAERVEEVHDEYARKLVSLEEKMSIMTGGINWRSPQQKARFLYDILKFKELTIGKGRNKRTKKTDKGGRCTDSTTLEKLEAKTKKQKEFIALLKEISKVGSALSKNLDYYKGIVEEKGGVFYFEFNQTRTATHRLSSSGSKAYFELFDTTKTAQGQNQPRAFKKLIKAKREGWKIAEIDGSQLEFRVGVQLSRDEQGREDILGDHDVHTFTACTFLKKDYAKVTKFERTEYKPQTFQPMYGGRGSTPEQQAYSEAFRERYSGMTEMQEGWVRAVTTSPENEQRLPWGMRFFWPHAKLYRDGKCNVSTNIFNYPIQSFATAEIIPIALVHFFNRVKQEKLDDSIRLINTVHDSVICELSPTVDTETFRRIAKRSFTTDVYEYLQRVYSYNFDFVPLGVGITVGDHWSEGEEVNYNVFPDGREETVN